MDQQIISVVLSFALGVGIGHLLQPWRLRVWRRAFRMQLPTRCSVCQRVVQNKETRHVQQHVYGEWTRICQRCWTDYYKPFGENDE